MFWTKCLRKRYSYSVEVKFSCLLSALQILNLSRNLVRVAASPFGFKSSDRHLLEMLARCVISMSFLLRGHINRESAKAELQAVLLSDELSWILVSAQPCLRVAQVCINLGDLINSQSLSFKLLMNEIKTKHDFIDHWLLIVSCHGSFNCHTFYQMNTPLLYILKTSRLSRAVRQCYGTQTAWCCSPW